MKASIPFRAIALAISILAGTGMSATSVIPMSIEKLTADSSDIVEAQVLDSRSEWNVEHTMIYTYTRVAVTKTLKGTAPNVVTVKQMGGHADGYTQRVSGVHYWEPGEEAVLFLRPSVSNDGTLVVTGLMQGNFRMSRRPSGEVIVSNSVPEVNAIDRTQARVAEFTGSRMPLQQMEERVRKAVEQ